MRISTFAALASLLPALAQATFFLSPRPGTTWEEASGQIVTWQYQAGGAPRGDIILRSSASNPKAVQTKVLATDVDLTQGSLQVPSGLGSSNSDSWTILMVNSNNYDSVYSQSGPFTVNSFAGEAESPAPAPGATSGGAVGNGSGEDDAPSTSPAPTRAPSTSSSPSRSSSSTTSTTSAPLVTATIESTASSGVLVTLTFTGDSASLANATSSSSTSSSSSSSASMSTASVISSPATTGAPQRDGDNGASRLGAGAAMLAGAGVVAVLAL
ncbi:hypothetical protein Rhopal_001644-T1 [Rhodotorula paludigena]|uniref:Yeast cell wall synthesis Kre9/Knh1-like N-terminal domain-containing protein n=1 Tax=Rhodotorula paludigena TaxID=86838 RepID=A0AAV5GEY7_9BASI|nr:hypothetical protein Rhopal_001644-T1 [Rhodotorula paludigena]